MSQQVNLLPREPASPPLSAARATFGLLAWVALLGGWGWYEKTDADHERQIAEQTARYLEGQKAVVANLKKKLHDLDEPGGLSAQIAALRPRTRVSEELLGRLQTGELGNVLGYGAQLKELARIRQEGVWITTLQLTNAGRSVRIEGRALQKQQVLQYARQLNDAMRKYDAQLTAMEMLPLEIARDGAATGAPAVRAYSFRLY